VRIKDLGTGLLPHRCAICLRMRRGACPQSWLDAAKSLWQERAWIHQGNQYSGSYQTPTRHPGWIEEERSGHLNFYLHNPSNTSAATAIGLFPASRQRLVPGHMGRSQRCQLRNHDHRTTDHGGLSAMKKQHLEEKRIVLVERREKLLARFNETARKRKSTGTCARTSARPMSSSTAWIASRREHGRPNTGPKRTRSARCS